MKRQPVVLFFVLICSCPLFAQDTVSRISPAVRAVRLSSPAVVNISTEKIVSVRDFNPFGHDWIQEFFEPYARRNVTRQSLGSGVIFRPDGTILTNEHVILPASKITATLSDGSEYPAQLIGASRRFDIAILKIESDVPFPYLPPGSSKDLMIGETVIAIGNPFGLASSVTTGVISALNRTVTFGDGKTRNSHTYHDFIQTDASINPGNSGGPLLNILGDLIGINTAIYTNAEGIGFAIPIDKTVRIIDDLIETGDVPRIWLGVHVQELTPMLAKNLHFTGKQGVLISEIRPDSPANRAGLRPGDIVLSIGDRKVSSPMEFRDCLREFTPGDRFDIEVWQRGRISHRTVTGIVFPESRSEELSWSLLGLTIAQLDRSGIQRNRLQTVQGVQVRSVRDDSPADQVGIRKGDAVIQVDGNQIENPKQFYSAVRQATNRDSITLIVVRRGTAYRVTLQVE
jgi:Do/DeqQ family serine protease